VRFKREILPGEKLEIETKVLSWKRGLCKGLGKGIVSGEIACEAEMIITIPEILDQYIPKK
jgi:3-hydroxyacyl-[acyl-carrier-protein] dehydratase